MRLQSVTLTNFRQFQGTQKFELGAEPDKPVSLLFGANGSGKTTLLNAFTWALYGSMSDDVEQQDRMVSDGVWRDLPAGGTVEVAVEVCFEHQKQNYRVLRSGTARKESDAQRGLTAEVRLWTTKPDGSSDPSDAPQETILSILPLGVSRFFFFNGERIENLVKKSAYTEVKKDIKVLLDIEQVERALAHLPTVDRKVSAELRNRGGNTASKIQEAIDTLTERQGRERESLSLIESQLATLREERDQTTNLLRQHAEAAPVQAQRDAVLKELEEARTALREAESERAVLVATRGFQAFTEGLCARSGALAASLYQKGALPAPLKREFVDQLLEDGACICGTPLIEHSAPWDHVRDWRQIAGLQAVETAWQHLDGQIGLLAGARDELRDRMAAVSKRIGTEKDRADALDEQRAELSGKLKGSRLEDVQQLEAKRLDLENRIGSKNQQKGAIDANLGAIAREIEQKRNDRSRAEVTDELAAKARSRSDLVQSVKRALEEIHAIREEEMRRRLDAELKAIFKTITHQNHIPTLSEGFELALHKDVNGVQLPVPKSTGENQILSLSFVAAVSKLAREVRQERRAGGGPDADDGSYPIVMDAAFGSLDQDYQQAVSRVLAKMAPQLVVLVSKSQGLGSVVKELMPYVGHLGVIETHTTSASGVADDIVLDGIAHPYIRSAPSDYSELKAIK